MLLLGALPLFYMELVSKSHKVLTYVEYRAVSGECVLPRTKGGGIHSAHSPGGEGDGGSIFWKTPAIGLASYNNLSTVTVMD
jgi:hypothetical protein